MRVLIADDHALVRSGFASLLMVNDIDVVGEACNGLEAVDMTLSLKPDIVLMDIKMPDCSGLEATRLIKAKMPQVKVVMVTAFDDDDDLFEAMKSGASGYVLKNVKAEDFIDLLSSVMDGDIVVSPLIASKIIDESFRNAGKLRVKKTNHKLTVKEEEVLELVAQGATNKEIASKLYISENTVKFHIRNIMEKLHFKNRAQIAVYGARHI